MFNRKNPLKTYLKDRKKLSGDGAKKSVYHLEIPIIGLEYEPGDALGVIPVNSNYEVSRLLEFLVCPNGKVFDSRDNSEYDIFYFLKNKADIKKVNLKVIELVKKYVENLDLHKVKADRDQYEIWDFLKEFNIKINAQELVEVIGRLRPRLYSISSSMAYVGREVHLCVIMVNYNTRGIDRVGLCSNYLCNELKTNDELQIYIHKNEKFRLPNDNRPVIMVGPGTGVAPFLSFIQERFKNMKNSMNWLFFGDWHKATDFYYEDKWDFFKNELEYLKVDTAFSRDQEHKVYVQDKIYENKKDIWKWIKNGANIYICGDAKRMALDVKKVFLKIILEEGGLGEAESNKFLSEMIADNRYLQDIY